MRSTEEEKVHISVLVKFHIFTGNYSKCWRVRVPLYVAIHSVCICRYALLLISHSITVGYVKFFLWVLYCMIFLTILFVLTMDYCGYFLSLTSLLYVLSVHACCSACVFIVCMS